MARKSRNGVSVQSVTHARGMVELLARQDGNEAETRRRVERIFETVLGYDPFAHLSREHAVRGAGETEHVDFAVTIDEDDRQPSILVELKRVGVDLARKHLKQVASYAINTGCEWILLTNARDWRLYHVAFGQPPETKLLSEWSLLNDGPDKLAERFELISFKSVKQGLLEDLWRKRKVLDPRNLLQAILSESSVRVLRRDLRRSTGVLLSLEDVIAGVRRLLNETALAELEEMTIRFPKRRRQRQAKEQEGERSPRPRVTVSQLIEAGMVEPPLALFRRYHGQRVEATVTHDGAIRFADVDYPNPSSAGEAAKMSITGQKQPTDGWRFWRCLGTEGTPRSLREIRDAFLKQHTRELPANSTDPQTPSHRSTENDS